MAGHQCEAVDTGLIKDRKIIRRNDDMTRGGSVFGVDLSIDLVRERPLQRLRSDDVARYEFVNAIERGLVGSAVACDCGVAWLARKWCLWEMTRALLQPLEVDALHHDEVRVDLLDREAGDGIARLRNGEITGRGHDGRLRRRGCGL